MNITYFFDFDSFSKTEITHAAVIGIFCYTSILFVRILDFISAKLRDKRFDERQARHLVKEGKLDGDAKKLAKKFGTGVTSDGLYEFIRKLIAYYFWVACSGAIDCAFLLSDAWSYIHMHELPYVSLFVTLAILFTEFTSIWENSPRNTKQNVEKSMRRFYKGTRSIIRDKDIDGLREAFIERAKRDE